MVWTRRGSGYAAAAPTNTFTLLRPNRFKGDGTKPGVILLHGAGATDSLFLTRPGNLATLARAIANAGFPCVAPSTGTPFGNDAGNTMIGEASALLTTAGAKPGARAFVGTSMGAQMAMVHARASPGSVSCLVGLLPLSDLDDLVTNNRGGNANAVHLAYGQRTDNGCGITTGSAVVTDSAIVSADAGRRCAGPGIPANATVGSVINGTSFQITVSGDPAPATATNPAASVNIGGYVSAVHGPVRNPESFKAQLAGLRTQVWYATDDNTIPPGTVTSVTTAIGATAELHPLTGGHTDAALAAVDTAAVLTFLRAYA